MKEKLKKIIHSDVVKTIGLVLVMGATAYVGSMMGIGKALNNYHMDVHLDGYDIIKRGEIDESIKEEA